MAKRELAFKNEIEFSRYATFISLLARGQRDVVAGRCGMSKQTMVRLASDVKARVRADTRRAVERLLAESAGILLTPTQQSENEEPAKTRKDIDSSGDKLMVHLRDALIEVAAACGDPSKLAAALNALLS